MNSINLNSAYLCVDCDMITDCASACSVCGSTALLSLAKVLGVMPKEIQPSMISAAIRTISTGP